MAEIVTREKFKGVVAARCPVGFEPRVERDIEYSYECYDDADGNEVGWITYKAGEEPVYYVRVRPVEA